MLFRSDTVIFTVVEAALCVLLVKRARVPGKEVSYPYQGRWSLVGGLVDITRDKSIEAAALRRLWEKTHVSSPYLEQLQSFGNGTRDPRKWSATVAYFALMSCEGVELIRGPKVDDVRWCPVDEALKLKLAFDHDLVLRTGIDRLRAKVEYTSIPANLLPTEFTLPELQQIYEIVLGRPLDKSSFRKRTLAVDFIEEVPRMREGRSRPAQLYRIKAGRTHVVFPRRFYV